MSACPAETPSECCSYSLAAIHPIPNDTTRGAAVQHQQCRGYFQQSRAAGRSTHSSHRNPPQVPPTGAG